MGKKSSGTQTTSHDSHSNSWLLENEDMKNILENVIGNSGNMPDHEYIGMNEIQKQALEQLIKGRDEQGIKDQLSQLGGISGGLLSDGQKQLGSASQSYDKLANMSNDDYLSMIQNSINSDLVDSQKQQLSKDINKQYDSSVQALNQQAGATGNMGSSRAGVTQAALAGKAGDSLALGNLGIDQNAYGNALNSVSSQLGYNMAGAQGQAGLGQFGIGQGMGGLNTSMNWYNQLNSNRISDLNNSMMAGGMYQNEQQMMTDIQRMNQIYKDNPYLGQLELILPTIGSTAGWGTHSWGTQTTPKQSQGGGFMGALGGLGGAALGGWLGGPMGAGIGSSVGSGLGNAIGGGFR